MSGIHVDGLNHEEYAAVRSTDSSSPNHHVEASMTPASDNKFHNEILEIDIVQKETSDLQSEIAAVGLNSLNSSDRQDTYSSFNDSFEFKTTSTVLEISKHVIEEKGSTNIIETDSSEDIIDNNSQGCHKKSHSYPIDKTFDHNILEETISDNIETSENLLKYVESSEKHFGLTLKGKVKNITAEVEDSKIQDESIDYIDSEEKCHSVNDAVFLDDFRERSLEMFKEIQLSGKSNLKEELGETHLVEEFSSINKDVEISVQVQNSGLNEIEHVIQAAGNDMFKNNAAECIDGSEAMKQDESIDYIDSEENCHSVNDTVSLDNFRERSFEMFKETQLSGQFNLKEELGETHLVEEFSSINKEVEIPVQVQNSGLNESEHVIQAVGNDMFKNNAAECIDGSEAIKQDDSIDYIDSEEKYHSVNDTVSLDDFKERSFEMFKETQPSIQFNLKEELGETELVDDFSSINKDVEIPVQVQNPGLNESEHLIQAVGNDMLKNTAKDATSEEIDINAQNVIESVTVNENKCFEMSSSEGTRNEIPTCNESMHLINLKETSTIEDSSSVNIVSESPNKQFFSPFIDNTEEARYVNNANISLQSAQQLTCFTKLNDETGAMKDSISEINDKEYFFKAADSMPVDNKKSSYGHVVKCQLVKQSNLGDVSGGNHSIDKLVSQFGNFSISSQALNSEFNKNDSEIQLKEDIIFENNAKENKSEEINQVRNGSSESRNETDTHKTLLLNPCGFEGTREEILTANDNVNEISLKEKSTIQDSLSMHDASGSPIKHYFSSFTADKEESVVQDNINVSFQNSQQLTGFTQPIDGKIAKEETVPVIDEINNLCSATDYVTLDNFKDLSTDNVVKTQLVEKSKLDDVIGDTPLTDKLILQNENITTGLHVQNSTPNKNESEIQQTGEILFQNIAKEIIPEELNQGSDNSSNSMIETNVNNTYLLEVCGTVEASEEMLHYFTVNENIHETSLKEISLIKDSSFITDDEEFKMHSNTDISFQNNQQNSFAGLIDETRSINGCVSKTNDAKSPYAVKKIVSVDDFKDTSVDGVKAEKVEESNVYEVPGDTNSTDELISQNEDIKISPQDQCSGLNQNESEIHITEDIIFQNNVKETLPEELQPGTDYSSESMNETDVINKTHLLDVSSFEENREEIFPASDSMYEISLKEASTIKDSLTMSVASEIPKVQCNTNISFDSGQLNSFTGLIDTECPLTAKNSVSFSDFKERSYDCIKAQEVEQSNTEKVPEDTHSIDELLLQTVNTKLNLPVQNKSESEIQLMQGNILDCNTKKTIPEELQQGTDFSSESMNETYMNNTHILDVSVSGYTREEVITATDRIHDFSLKESSTIQEDSLLMNVARESLNQQYFGSFTADKEGSDVQNNTSVSSQNGEQMTYFELTDENEAPISNEDVSCDVNYTVHLNEFSESYFETDLNHTDFVEQTNMEEVQQSGINNNEYDTQTIEESTSENKLGEITIPEEILRGKVKCTVYNEMEHLKNNNLLLEENILSLKTTLDELKKENDDLKNTLQSQGEKNIEILHKEHNEIERLKNNNSLLEENVLYLKSTLDKLENENEKLINILQSEGEKEKEVDRLTAMLGKQNNEIIDQNERLSKLSRELNEKEQQINNLFLDQANLEKTVTSLNNQVEELRKIEDKLKLNLQEEINKNEEVLVFSKSLEEKSSMQAESITKLNSELCNKDSQIMSLINSNSELKDAIEVLNQKLNQLKEFEKENENLRSSMKQNDKELNNIKSSFEEQVSNLKAQNDLLWNQLKVSSSKEQNIFALKEERLLLEEKLCQMKSEIQDINNLKSDNKHLVEVITNKDSEIHNLISDKKQLKKSLMKASDKLNERDIEIEKLSELLIERDTEIDNLSENLKLKNEKITSINEERIVLQNNLDELTKQEEILKGELAENIGNVSEFISSLMLENANLIEKVTEYEGRELNITCKIKSMKEELLESKNVFNSLQTEKESLLASITNLKETVSLLTKELDGYKKQCSDITNLKEENTELSKTVQDLNEKLLAMENERICQMEDMSSLSETISSLLFDSQALSEQLKISSEMSERLALITEELDGYKKQCSDITNVKEENIKLSQTVQNLNEKLIAMENERICQMGDMSGLSETISSLLFDSQALSEQLKISSEMSERLAFITAEHSQMEKQLFQCDQNNQMLRQSILTLQNQLQDALAKEKVIDELMERNLHFENKLSDALVKESEMNQIKEENQILLKVAEIHKGCEEVTCMLQKEKSALEFRIETLTEAFETQQCKQNISETQMKEYLQLKEVMIGEINSLTGDIWNAEVEPLIDVYKKLMKEFINKEKEVIFSLQSDYEGKIKVMEENSLYLNNELKEREIVISQLESELHESKIQLNHRDNIISSLEHELLAVKNEINNHQIQEIKLQAESEKEALLVDLNNMKSIKSELEEKISNLIKEIASNNKEICQLQIDLKNVSCEKENLLRIANYVEQQEVLIDELKVKFNNEQLFTFQLNQQLVDKNIEISQLTESLEKKEVETRQHQTRIEEMEETILKLSAIEMEFNAIKYILSTLELDLETNVDSSQSCRGLGDVLSDFVKTFKKLQITNNELKMELSDQIKICKSLENQTNDMNEEIKSCKLLYDEDFLQFKEELAAKNLAIANLTESLEQLKQNTCLGPNSKTELAELEIMKDDLNKLREENKQLQNYSTKITEVNRKLSWEIEELSRSIKSEKQNNLDLKAKCDLATSQVAELSKNNLQLNDKIEALEGKLNYDVMSSLTIVFPPGVNTVDKQVQYLHGKVTECDQINVKFNKLTDEYDSMKHEYEKSKEYIRNQDQKLSKYMKRELELKKQLNLNLQTSNDSNILKELKTELLSLFPEEKISLNQVLVKIKVLVQSERATVKSSDTTELEEKIEELSQENKDLDLECEMMNKKIKEQEELLASVFKREEYLKKRNEELESQINRSQYNRNPCNIDDNGLEELFEVFKDKPSSLKSSINLVKGLISENQSLKEQVFESKEEYASLDKECEDMLKAYKEKEKDLEDVLKREANTVSSFQIKQQELEEELRLLSEKLKMTQENTITSQAPCQCEELKSQLLELKVDLAKRNAKITALEMEFEADNFPLKKKVAELEKSLNQAKQKINELKSEVRRNQEQMCDFTVGIRTECERCRSLGTTPDSTLTSTLTTLQQELQEKTKEIHILKALCKTRNQRIKELEERDTSQKLPRSQRSALKEVKENKTTSLPPIKHSKDSLHQ